MWGEPQFDKHAFAGRRAKAVKATKTREGWDTTGISYADFGSMHVHHREETQVRKLPTPEWANNDVGLRRAVLRFCERYVYINKPTGTDAERLQAIRDKAKAMLPSIEKRLNITLRQYHESNGGQREGKRDFSITVQNLDRMVQILRRGLPELVTAVMMYYYRLGWNSVKVAEELKLTPPAVREWLYRMNRREAGLKTNKGRRATVGTLPWPKETLWKLFIMRAMGMKMKECASALGVCHSTVLYRWRQAFGDFTVGKYRRHQKFDAVVARCLFDERITATRRKPFPKSATHGSVSH